MPGGRFNEDAWRTRLNEVGLRATEARLRVLESLAGAAAPLTAQEIADALPPDAADRVTIYRTLAALTDAGLAHRIDPGDRVWRFRLDDRRSAHEHPHFVCDDCGAVQCLDGARVRVSLPGDTTAAARPARITQSDVYLHGRCAECSDPLDR
ncbi:MAG: Fur family transcriptional regulator [Planctomycetota bacterium]|nr:Fur family transcriptional regulator [Planctomycetota bacterium]